MDSLSTRRTLRGCVDWNKTTATQRLNNHEEQNKALLVLAEQVKTLSEDVKELKILITKGE